jgi:hypothetical protein
MGQSSPSESDDLDRLLALVPSSSESDDLERLLALVPPSPRSDASEADLALASDLVRESALIDDKFGYRGHRLCKMMRKHKKLLGQARLGQIAPHVLEQVRAFNDNYAQTAVDIIDLAERRPVRVAGKGVLRAQDYYFVLSLNPPTREA